jgi:hypothetical protein
MAAIRQRSRISWTLAEYQQIKFAFEKTILPFIDQEQMAKVRERQWFQPAELQEK